MPSKADKRTNVRYGSKADMCGAMMDVRYGPKADIHKERKDRREAVSPKIHQFFDALKLARSAVMTLPLSRSAASTQQV